MRGQGWARELLQLGAVWADFDHLGQGQVLGHPGL
jgi:hypothetical protein